MKISDEVAIFLINRNKGFEKVEVEIYQTPFVRSLARSSLAILQTGNMGVFDSLLLKNARKKDSKMILRNVFHCKKVWIVESNNLYICLTTPIPRSGFD